MVYVIAATWHVQDGNEERVAQIIGKMAHLSRQEPGCLLYQPHRSPDDPLLFFLYEQYADEAAARTHSDSEYFQRYVLQEALPLLKSRERAIYQTMDV
ncbi:MAG: putative quinol monooxygenase [Chloroflexota bacterium]